MELHDPSSAITLNPAINCCAVPYYGSEQCRCKPGEVKKYQGKISGPILDRIDLKVELRRLTTDERFAVSDDSQTSTQIREQVEAARSRQARRFSGKDIPFNAAMPGGQVLALCYFAADGAARYRAIVDENPISTRSMDRLAKVSRTVADLGNSEQVEPVHVDTAATFVLGGFLNEQQPR